MPIGHRESMLPVSTQVNTDPDDIPVCNGKEKKRGVPASPQRRILEF